MVNCLFSYCHTLKMILFVQDNFQGVNSSEANGLIQVRESTSTKRPLPQIFIHVREANLHQYCFCSSVQKGRGGGGVKPMQKKLLQIFVMAIW